MINIGEYCLESNLNVKETVKNIPDDKSVSFSINDEIQINIYSSELSVSNLDKSVTYINLGECQSKVNEFYNLEQSSKLYVMTLDMNKRSVNSSVSNCEYEIYLQNGTLVENA